MFSLDSKPQVSMGLQRMLVDWATTSKDPKNNTYKDKAERFRANTTGMTTGGKEQVESIIAYKLSQHRELQGDEAEVYTLVLEKLSKEGKDYNVAITDVSNIGAYVKQNIEWVFKSIFSEKSKNKGNYRDERYVSEEDRAEDDTITETTEDKLFKSGTYAGIGDAEDLEFTEEEARQLLVSSLDLMKLCQDTMLTTDSSHINALRILQSHIAHDEFVEDQEELTEKYGGEADSQMIKAKQTQDLAVSYGLAINANIKQIKMRTFSEDYVTNKRLFKAYRNMLQACNRLEIPVVEIDAETVMNEDYIRELYMILNHKETVCISEYELDMLEVDYTLNDLHKAYIKDKAIEEGVPARRMPFYFTYDIMENISRLKASEYRKLDNLAKEVEFKHSSYMENYKFAEKKEGEKNSNEIMKESPEYKWRVNYTRTTLLRGYVKESTKKEPVELKGVFSPESLEIIREYTERFLDNTFITDPMKAKNLYSEVQKVIDSSKRPLVADGNGFLKYADNGHYYEVTGPKFGEKGPSNKRFEFRKWLVNEKGFMVSKFLDADPKVKSELEVYRTPNDNGFEGLFIVSVLGDKVLEGYYGK